MAYSPDQKDVEGIEESPTRRRRFAKLRKAAAQDRDEPRVRQFHNQVPLVQDKVQVPDRGRRLIRAEAGLLSNRPPRQTLEQLGQREHAPGTCRHAKRGRAFNKVAAADRIDWHHLRYSRHHRMQYETLAATRGGGDDRPRPCGTRPWHRRGRSRRGTGGCQHAQAHDQARHEHPVRSS